MKRELLFQNSTAEVGFKCEAPMSPGVHLRLEETKAPTALPPDPTESCIGAVENSLCIRTVKGVH